LLDNTEQESLYIDSTGGKSINAIRAFAGKGTVVWGARTLAGNDNEWRYVSVRRFFTMIEVAVKQGTAWAVFEPNDANLWVKVRAQIENYLTQQWRSGGLAGARPEQAFHVNCGLGQTMTTQDVQQGRMIVEIGMAVVRPAEFIILKVTHQLQSS
jgi:phage tail sheath protein FI